MVINEPPPSAPRLSHSKINLAREPSEARVQARETMHSQAESTGQALGLWTQSGFMEVRGHGGQARLILVLKVSLCRTQVQARVSFSSKHRKVRGKISSFAINFGSSWAHSNKPSRRDRHWVEGQPPSCLQGTCSSLHFLKEREFAACLSPLQSPLHGFGSLFNCFLSENLSLCNKTL